MSKVECEVRPCQVENSRGILVDGVIAECSRCGHATESVGTSERSVRRCLAMMREECPEDEENFYVADEDSFTGD